MQHAILFPTLLLLWSSSPAPAQTCEGRDELYPLDGNNVSASSDATTVVGDTFVWDENQGIIALVSLVGLTLERPVISGDGLVIVGARDNAIFRWSAITGTQFIGTTFSGVPRPQAIDQDGGTFVGSVDLGGGQVAIGIWKPSGLEVIPHPTALVAIPTDISGDGETVVGFLRATSGSLSVAFRWTQAAGFEELGTLLPGSSGSSRASAVNFDGSVVAGVSGPGMGVQQPFIWSPGPVGVQPLDVPAGLYDSEVTDISADGRFVVGSVQVGSASSPGPQEPTRWSASGEPYSLPLPPFVSWTSARGVAVSGDGSYAIVAGSGTNRSPLYRVRTTQLGTTYCEFANPNSSGCYSRLEVRGSAVVSDNAVTLSARRLPVDVFGFFLISGDTGSTPLANSNGILCLGGFIGRFVEVGQIRNSGLDGFFELGIDLTSVPLQFGTGAIQAGETWNFQAWHRDVDAMGSATSNLTDAVAVTFR